VSLPRYLVSRSLAGATHKDIARGISLSTNGAAVTKFFAFYPERKVSLSHWLHYWISKGKKLENNTRELFDENIKIHNKRYMKYFNLHFRCCTNRNVELTTLWRGL